MTTPKLGTQTIRNWDPIDFMAQSDTQADATVSKTLDWYAGFEKQYADAAQGGAKSQRAFAEFESAVGELRGTYDRARQDVSHGRRLDGGERAALIDASRVADEKLTFLQEHVAKDGAPKFEGRYARVPNDALDAVARGDRELGLGAKGEAVRDAQQMMLKHGAKLDDYGADGFLGSVTEREISKLQTKWGLEANGKLDAATLEHLRGAPEAKSEPRAKAEPQVKAEPQLKAEPQTKAEAPAVAPNSERAQLEKRADALGPSHKRLAAQLRRQARTASPDKSGDVVRLETERDEAQAKLRQLPPGRQRASVERKLKALNEEIERERHAS